MPNWLITDATKRRIEKVLQWFGENGPPTVYNPPGGGKLDPLRIPPYVTFRVTLVQSGGSNGNKTTAPTYTYHVYHPTDTSNARKLNTASSGAAVSPEKERPFGLVTAATIGLAYYDNTGTIKLYEAYEKPGRGGCP